MSRYAAIAAFGLLIAPAAQAAELTVLTSGGFTAAYKALIPAYEKQTGDTLHTELGASMGDTPTAIPQRLKRGETADVVIMVGGALDGLLKDGAVLAGSRRAVANSSIGMAVKSGAPKPDISTAAALKQVLLDAKSIAYSDSASGVYLQNEMFPKLGIADAIKGRAHMIPGDPVGGVVADGGAEIGFQQIAELKPVRGIEIVGPLPPDLQRVTPYAAGVAAGSKHPAEAQRLVDFLASPAAAAAVRDSGLDTP